MAEVEGTVPSSWYIEVKTERDRLRERQARLAALFADAVRDRPDRTHWLGLWNEALEAGPKENGGTDG